MLPWLALALAPPPLHAAPLGPSLHPGGLRPCGTLALLPGAPPVLRGEVSGSRQRGKGVRDVYSVPNQRTSPDFAVHWGNQGSVTNAAVDDLLDSFQTAWRVQIEEMRHRQPYGTDSWKFNVYIGDTGGGAPSSSGAAGYYYVDREGWPMIVIAESSLRDLDYAESTAAHEFYHAVQNATDRYAYSGRSAWYWEATAEWAALQTVPENPTNGGLLFGYLLLTELPVNFFDYPDSGDLTEYHQYGAFLFPHDLTAQVGWELVRDSWKDNGTEPDPMEVLRRLLAEQGEDLDEMWLDHLGHIPAWDFPQGDLFEQHMETYGSWFGDEAMLQDTVTGVGGEGSSRGAKAPGRYGAALIRLRRPIAGNLTATLTGEELGTEGSPARYGGRLVRERADGSVEYTPIVFDGPNAVVELEGIEETDDLHLAVGAWTEAGRTWDTEKFPFDWSISVVPAPPDPEPGDRPGRGGGQDGEIVLTCDQGGVGALGALALGLPLAALRRRRSP